MTSEVVIINSQGIALAADSAVTIGSQKTYNSAIKLFSLSKFAPIGIMIYGRADLLGVPWELIIKSFRKELASKTFPTLKEYADLFIDFIASSTFCSQANQIDWVERCANYYYMNLRSELFDEVHEYVKEHGEISLDTTKDISKKIISCHHKELKQKGFVPKYSSSEEKQHRKQFKGLYQKLINDVFEKVPLSNQTKSKLYDIATYLITRNICNRHDVSGVVIAGYGEQEFFPGVITHEITGLVNNKLKYQLIEDKSLIDNTKGVSVIIPFADDTMITTFMRGISPSISNFMIKYLTELFAQLPEFIGECFKLDDPYSNKSFIRGMEIITEDAFDALQYQQKNQHIDSVMRMVNALPKDELAAMAESLVSLTAFKRKMSHSVESVGGPVDVAVISKGDGLVWVKRKHYFPPELNHSFFQSY